MGNEKAASMYLASYNSRTSRLKEPDASTNGNNSTLNLQKTKAWIRAKYVDKSWCKSDGEKISRQEEEQIEKAIAISKSEAEALKQKKKNKKKSVAALAREPRIPVGPTLVAIPAATIDLFSVPNASSKTTGTASSGSNFAFEANFDAFGTEPPVIASSVAAAKSVAVVDPFDDFRKIPSSMLHSSNDNPPADQPAVAFEANFDVFNEQPTALGKTHDKADLHSSVPAGNGPAVNPQSKNSIPTPQNCSNFEVNCSNTIQNAEHMSKTANSNAMAGNVMQMSSMIQVPQNINMMNTTNTVVGMMGNGMMGNPQQTQNIDLFGPNIMQPTEQTKPVIHTSHNPGNMVSMIQNSNMNPSVATPQVQNPHQNNSPTMEHDFSGNKPVKDNFASLSALDPGLSFSGKIHVNEPKPPSNNTSQISKDDYTGSESKKIPAGVEKSNAFDSFSKLALGLPSPDDLAIGGGSAGSVHPMQPKIIQKPSVQGMAAPIQVNGAQHSISNFNTTITDSAPHSNPSLMPTPTANVGKSFHSNSPMASHNQTPSTPGMTQMNMNSQEQQQMMMMMQQMMQMTPSQRQFMMMQQQQMMLQTPQLGQMQQQQMMMQTPQLVNPGISAPAAADSNSTNTTPIQTNLATSGDTPGKSLSGNANAGGNPFDFF
eukprot:CAMPEP_0194294988 /NCGR_PEP_ID=MMETSP0169-20130528/52315_1 /TAXON_ID=218684 /ORGANISM="Corethron pennatum, Strain L29A3" /LENGTH=654 /DNA_ID=CAMNT_0039044055 /DNA_START=396 /DNA_END=2360 /DNA_ORIENTATION=+